MALAKRDQCLQSAWMLILPSAKKAGSSKQHTPVLIPMVMKDAIVCCAEEQGITSSQLMRQLLGEYLKAVEERRAQQAQPTASHKALSAAKAAPIPLTGQTIGRGAAADGVLRRSCRHVLY